MSLSPSAYSPSDVEYTIKPSNLKKAPGYELITPKILKHLPKKALLFLTYIHNAQLIFLQCGNFPNDPKTQQALPCSLFLPSL